MAGPPTRTHTEHPPITNRSACVHRVEPATATSATALPHDPGGVREPHRRVRHHRAPLGAGSASSPHYIRELCKILGATPSDLGFLLDADGQPLASRATGPRALDALGLDPDDEPDVEDLH